MEILHINLDSRPNRNDRFLKLNAGIEDFTRIPPADGRTLHIPGPIAGRVLNSAAPARYLM